MTVLVCDVAAGAAERDAPTFYGSAAEWFTEQLESGTP